MPTVLIVDDSSVDRTMIEGLLKKEPSPFTVVCAEDATHALKLMDEHHVDVVVTDLAMPNMDGLELVRLASEKHPLVPIVLMTSRGDETFAVKALRAGAASYIPKSCLSSELVETINHLLEWSSQKRSHARLVECMTTSVCSFELRNDHTLIPPLVGYLQDEVTNIGLCDRTDRVRIGVALDEALVNALFHGNLELSSHVRDKTPDEYHRQVEQRCQQPPFRDRRIYVSAEISATQAKFTIRDDGQGFEQTQLSDPRDSANLDDLGGRGILLMRTFMDEVTFNKSGNEVVMIKRRSQCPNSS